MSEANDSSAISTFRFPTVFQGSNRFVGNVGGGITLLNTVMNVRENGSLLFEGNTAAFGAGIAMDDRCLVGLFVCLFV